MSEICRVFLILFLVVISEGNVRENKANLSVTCSESAMNIQMDFMHPFKGIVFTHNNYFNPLCSYAVSPTSTVLHVNLTLPFESCATKLQLSSNKSTAFNTIMVEQHRMLDTSYDYVQNVSCELPVSTPEISTFNGTSVQIPLFESWINFQLGNDLFPEEIVDEMDIGHELFLTYHINDGGTHKDMMVMNCIGHDDLIVDEKTNLYQFSNPFGCSSDSDLLSHFSVIRNSQIGSNMISYAMIKNVSLIVRGKFYVTCGAVLCIDACDRRCSGINQQADPLYFTDMATKGMVNRALGSRIPPSLLIFERSGRQRRAENKTGVDYLRVAERAQVYNSKMERLTELVEKFSFDIRNKSEFVTLHSDISNVTESVSVYQSKAFQQLLRSKRKVSFQTSQLSSLLKVFYIQRDSDGKTYDIAVHNVTRYYSSSNTSENFKFPAAISPVKLTSAKVLTTTKKETDISGKEEKTVSFNGHAKAPETIFTLKNIIITIVIVSSLFVLSFVCYTLFFVRREPETFVSDYATYSHF